MNRKVLYLLFLVMLFSLLLPLTTLAQDGIERGPITVLGNTYTLPSGHTLDGDLSVLGGTAILEEGSTVNGDVVVMDGSLTCAGTINGDLVVFGGSASLRESAVVRGEIVNFGGSISRASGAEVEGGFTTGPTWRWGWHWPKIWRWGRIYTFSPDTFLGRILNFWFHVAKILFTTLLLAGLAALIALLLPDPSLAVIQKMKANPANAIIAGLLSYAAGFVSVIILTATVCLSPFAVVIVLLLVALGFYSWILFGTLIGQSLTKKARQAPSLPVQAALGTALLTLAYELIAWLPLCPIDLFLLAIACSWGTGTLILRFLNNRQTQPSTPATPALEEHPDTSQPAESTDTDEA